MLRASTASSTTLARARDRSSHAHSHSHSHSHSTIVPRTLNRRDALVASVALATGLASRRARAEPLDTVIDVERAFALGKSTKKPRVIITGGNSGIGRAAATTLAREGKWVVALACRTRAKAEDTREAIARAYPEVNVDDIECYACDLGSMASVRAFAREVVANDASVDALCLNAGVEYSGDPTVHRTVDGFEETIGVNHLGHFLLANLLLPALESSALEHPRVVVTASEVHDPSSPGGSVGKGATLGTLNGFIRDGKAFEMVSGEAFDADKAYKDSKLCNMLFTYELERRLRAKGSKVNVNAFGPGLITRTGLFRHQQPLFVKVFDFITNDVAHVAETVEGGGNTLVYMLEDQSLEGVGGVYFNNTLSPGTPPTGHAFVQTDSSDESLRADEAANLWALSERLVGL